ncbi:hypothetical protein L917_18656 [Phytophthora nicotianae]|uniref:Uncharacterized protein n=2 Tax=Phytophthora nicotianae TaxID=4792 RepID=W2QY70_PHYN3|nr:hypothetical protein PPTG_21708 [Phytophthora nicotianae INRA-310]ETK74226.1 hypothetical protein L915_18933 [Phytophthora nicotianae]ETL80896.1 hypothetical protein L917_18656 [Phytophthora nicotianae]ETN17906.1 hypothetical protein PPTG_21708 [Phytophthora nicotianae INRA-310]
MSAVDTRVVKTAAKRKGCKDVGTESKSKRLDRRNDKWLPSDPTPKMKRC